MPAWLPDSTHLVFAALIQGASGRTHRAFVVNVVAPPAALTPASGLPADPNVDLAAPVPSPDGHQIAFVSGNQVWLMNGDGTRPTPLTTFDPESFLFSKAKGLSFTEQEDQFRQLNVMMKNAFTL